jgi:hypothetical protein
VLRLLGAEAAAGLAGQVATAREIGERQRSRRRGHLPSGLPALDRLLAAVPGAAGGLPRGGLVELTGRASAGRFAAVLSALAATPAGGEAAALVDLGDHLDPAAALDFGADLARLLWVRPRTMGEALAAAEAVLAGGFPLVVVDLGLPPVPGGRGVEAAWLRLARAAQAHGAALLVSSPYRVSGTAARQVLTGRPAGGLYAPVLAATTPPLLQGLGVHLTLDKARGRRPGATADVELVLARVHPEALLEPSRRLARHPAEPAPPATRRAARRAAAPPHRADGRPGEVAGPPLPPAAHPRPGAAGPSPA